MYINIYNLSQYNTRLVYHELQPSNQDLSITVQTKTKLHSLQLRIYLGAVTLIALLARCFRKPKHYTWVTDGAFNIHTGSFKLNISLLGEFIQ